MEALLLELLRAFFLFFSSSLRIAADVHGGLAQAAPVGGMPLI